MMETTDLLVIELSGTPRERGRIHGETAKQLIANVVSSLREDLGSFYQGCAARKNDGLDKYLNDFFQETNFIQAIRQWAPDLLEEVQGIAEGADQDFYDILSLQLMEAVLVYLVYKFYLLNLSQMASKLGY